MKSIFPVTGTGTPSRAAVDSACLLEPSGATISTRVVHLPSCDARKIIVTRCGRSFSGMADAYSDQLPASGSCRDAALETASAVPARAAEGEDGNINPERKIVGAGKSVAIRVELEGRSRHKTKINKKK